MAATVTWYEFNGANTPGNSVGSQATNINFGNSDVVNLTPASSPIQAGSNSYFKQIVANFSGSYTQISNLKLYKSAGDYVSGESLQFSGSVVVSAPATADQSDAAIPTSLPGSANVAPAGLTTAGVLPLAGESESSPGYYSGSRTSLTRFQLLTTGATPAGAVNQKTFTLSYDRQ